MNERIKKLANIWANRRAEDVKLGITYTFSEQFAKGVVKEYLAGFEIEVADLKERLNSYERTN